MVLKEISNRFAYMKYFRKFKADIEGGGGWGSVTDVAL